MDWTSVDDRLPDLGDRKPYGLARIVTDGKLVWTTKQHSLYWNRPDLFGECDKGVTHWMPLPEPPK